MERSACVNDSKMRCCASGATPGPVSRTATRSRTWSPSRRATPANDAAPRFGGSALVVDDDALNRLVAATMLQRMGLEVTVACDGLEAIELLERARYDVVFLDCQMPEMDGYEAARVLRARGSRVPLVAFTANVTSDDRARCLAAGMDDFVCKPVSERDLAAAVARWSPRATGSCRRTGS